MHIEDKSTIEVVKKVSPAVVSIIASKMKKKMPGLNPPGGMQGITPPVNLGPLDSKADSNSEERVNVGGGTGFFVKKNGIILTNKHVVFDADADYIVMMSDEKEYPAKVLTRDPINDIAIIQIDIEDAPVVEMETAASVEPGQTVIAIGNALGLFSNTVSKGVISGLSRQISAAMGNDQGMEKLRGVIQTDVAINQGNSGGPLINLDGKVIGINTAVIFGAQNIGFAIPIDRATKDLDNLEKYGRIIQPFLGVRYVMLSPEIQKIYGIENNKGALVIQDHIPGSVAVSPKSPADKAGIKQNDIILKFGDSELCGKIDLTDKIQELNVGDTVPIKIQRNGKEIDLEITLTERS